MSEPLALAALVGQELFIKVPAWKADQVFTIKLLGVEAGGIWVEPPDFMETMFEGTPYKMTQKHGVVFVPYGQIVAIYHFVEGTWISERVAQ